ncbi:hypothetical protein HPP92_019582 [Vanilla planifolia]|uniref:Uncharacterized protein n=1 Tax=Vanilla planifolia TaxID=51239 RepID=A0A835Q2K2_VANPL|nr:hypothetical protein HPP92_019582 [Vanilla planifolia]
MASLIVKVVIVGDESGFLYQLEYADLMVTQENIMKAEFKTSFLWVFHSPHATRPSLCELLAILFRTDVVNGMLMSFLEGKTLKRYGFGEGNDEGYLGPSLLWTLPDSP